MSTATLKPKLLVTRLEDDMPKEAIDLLKNKFEIEFWMKELSSQSLYEKIQDKDAIFCCSTEKIDLDFLSHAKSLKVVGSMAVGFDHIDTEALKARGIKAGYTPGVLTDATAELTVALLLATSRRLFEGSEKLRNGGWTAWTPLWLCGTSLHGSTVGIVGLGRIGQGVQSRLKAFGVAKFLYTGRQKKSEDLENGAEFVSFDDLLTNSDFVIATCSFNPNTKDLFDKNAFTKMKKSAIFVNSSRGGVVNQADLYEALTNGTISAAGLDVMTPEPLPVDHPLTKLPNCVLIPHMGSGTVETRTQMAVLTAQNIIAGFEDKPMPAQLC